MIQNIPCYLVICYTQSWPGHSPYSDLLYDCFDIPLVSHQFPNPSPFQLMRLHQAEESTCPLSTCGGSTSALKDAACYPLGHSALLARMYQILLGASPSGRCMLLRSQYENSLPQSQPQVQASAEVRAAETHSASSWPCLALPACPGASAPASPPQQALAGIFNRAVLIRSREQKAGQKNKQSKKSYFKSGRQGLLQTRTSAG